MENKIFISVLDYSEYPGLRYVEQGDDSGEDFYYKILKPKFEEVLQRSEQQHTQCKLVIDLDNTAGYASSFLDEAFGNLAYDFGEEKVKSHLEIKSNQEPDWVNVIFSETIPEWQKKKEKGIERKTGKRSG